MNTLRVGRAEDIPAIVMFRNLEADYSEYVSKTSTREEKQIYGKYSSGNNIYFVVEDGDKIVGNSVFMVHDSEGHIGRVAVAHDRRGQGIGKMLIEASLARCKTLGVRKCRLLVNPKNKEALGLYQKYNFVQIGQTINLDGEELCRMVCLIN